MKKLLMLGILASTPAFCGNNNYHEEGPVGVHTTYDCPSHYAECFWRNIYANDYDLAAYYLTKFKPISFHDRMYKDLCRYYLADKLHEEYLQEEADEEIDLELAAYVNSDD